MAECRDITILKGQSKGFELIFTERNAAFDITDWTIYFTVKTNMGDSDGNAIIDKKVITFTNPTGGQAIIELSSSDTNITAKNYWYSMDYKDPDDNVGTLFSGKLTIRKSVRDTKD